MVESNWLIFSVAPWLPLHNAFSAAFAVQELFNFLGHPFPYDGSGKCMSKQMNASDIQMHFT